MENEHELLEFLKKAGFEGETLERQIRSNIKSSSPQFEVTHEKTYGHDSMRFRLKFEWDVQFEAYRLTGYLATYFSLQVDHAVIDGIDTAELEKQMKALNWESWFNEDVDHQAQPEYLQAIAQLDRLSRHGKGFKIEATLKIKYWPDKALSDGLLAYRQMDEHSRHFGAHSSGICHVNLAYMHVSGRFERLYQSLRKTGLEEYPGMALYEYLERTLKNLPEHFNVQYAHNTPEGLIEFRIPVSRDGYDYIATSNFATFTPHPPTDFGAVVSKLESQMRRIDWNDERALVDMSNEMYPNFIPSIQQIYDQLSQLARTPEGARAADLLMLKYWTASPVMEDFVEDSAWHEFNSRPCLQQTFPLTMDCLTIYNFMAGRPAMLKTSMPDDYRMWSYLDTSTTDADGKHPVRTIEGPSIAELKGMLKMLPTPYYCHDNALNQLLKGSLASLPVSTPSDKQIVLLQVVPEQKTLALFTMDSKPIPFNFHLDEHWRPQIAKEQAPKHFLQLKSKNRGRRL